MAEEIDEFEEEEMEWSDADWEDIFEDDEDADELGDEEEESEEEDGEGIIEEKENSEDKNLENDDISKGQIYMKGTMIDEEVIKINVLAKDLEIPVTGLSFYLNYTGENLSFLKYEPGEFLEDGGDPVYLVKDDDEKNQIVFGETLKRKDDFPKGGGLVASFYFQIIKKDGVKFEFKNGVVSVQEEVRQDLSKVKWQGLILSKSKIKNPGNEDLEADNWNFEYSDSKRSGTSTQTWIIVAIATILMVTTSVLATVFFLKKNDKICQS